MDASVLTKEFLTKQYVELRKSPAAIAASLQIPISSVGNISTRIRAFGLNRSEDPESFRPLWHDIIEGYTNGINIASLATRYSMSGASICRVLQLNNITLRPRKKKEKPPKIKKKRIEIVGVTFGTRLVVDKFKSLKMPFVRYRFVCQKCGLRGNAGLDCLRNRGCRGCVHVLPFRGVGDFSIQFYKRIQRAAGYRGIDFSVSMEFLWDLFLKQNGRCALSGRKIQFNKDYKGKAGEGVRMTASLDRIDSTKGYTEDNVQWVHRKVNSMKHDLDQDEFLVWCEDIISNHRRKFSNKKASLPP